MSRLPIPHFINQIKTKLGFDRTLTASGEDVVDAVNKQSQQIANVGNAIAIVISGNIAPIGGVTARKYYIWNGSLRLPTSSISAGETLTDSNMPVVQDGGLNQIAIQPRAYTKNTTYLNTEGTIMVYIFGPFCILQGYFKNIIVIPHHQSDYFAKIDITMGGVRYISAISTLDGTTAPIAIDSAGRFKGDDKDIPVGTWNVNAIFHI